MSISLQQSQAVGRLANTIAEFLPGKPHPYADQALSFPGVARALGLDHLWSGGSKKPAVIQLLERTLDKYPAQFCRLLTEIVRAGLRYRSTKAPISREEMDRVNADLLAIGFKIPEFVDPGFLNGFPRHSPVAGQPQSKTPATTEDLRQVFNKLHSMEEKARGFAFEKFLRLLFDANGLQGRSPFRLVGEQIDGSFVLGDATYLIEAKWQNKPLDVTPLFSFDKQIEKASWTRGLFVSYSGFSDEALLAMQRTGKLNFIGMSGQDIHFILEGKIGFVEAIRAKLRLAGEGAGFMVPVFELLLKVSK